MICIQIGKGTPYTYENRNPGSHSGAYPNYNQGANNYPQGGGQQFGGQPQYGGGHSQGGHFNGPTQPAYNGGNQQFGTPNHGNHHGGYQTHGH